MKIARGLNNLFCEVRRRELGFFILENRRLQGDFLMAFQYIKKACKKNTERLFSRACKKKTPLRACSDRTNGKWKNINLD